MNAAHFSIAKRLTTPILPSFVVLCAAALFVLSQHYGHVQLGLDRHLFVGGFVRGGFGFFAGLLLYRLRQSGRLPAVRFHWLLLIAALPVAILLARFAITPSRWYPGAAIIVFIMPAICWAGVHCPPAGPVGRTCGVRGLNVLSRLCDPSAAAVYCEDGAPILYGSRYVGCGLWCPVPSRCFVGQLVGGDLFRQADPEPAQ